MDEQQQWVRPESAADGDVLIELPLEPAPPVAKPRRRRVTTMTAVVVGSGVLAAGVTMGPTAMRMLAQKDAALTTPAAAAGLVRDDTAQAVSTAEDLRSVVAARFALDTTLGVIYNDPGSPTRTVLLVGGTAFLGSPADDLDSLFQLLDDTAGGVAGIHEVDAGSLGGVVKCGSADSADGAMSVCGWADHGSLALSLFPGRDVDDSAAVLRDLRTAIEHRS
ncbi:hypothetical protein F4553_003191 [Allocatelliglobosispora scoriae]|uniref:Uncharacterized protein n=1 Tax=Allocatelliglobosispora scoriae TaxID=643052 RepID=A0A841BSU7_9ACTN|nr:hypothetical protein [Allocatelliglobosispora scoriae]MBB5869812.1 hypothetical protein [Allocatelliglobosispora scoriae]